MYQENIRLNGYHYRDFKCSIFPTILYHFVFLTDKYGERFCSILTTALTSNTWKVQVVLLAAIKLFIERLVFIQFSLTFLKACFSFIAEVGPHLFSCSSEWTGLMELPTGEERRILTG